MYLISIKHGTQVSRILALSYFATFFFRSHFGTYDFYQYKQHGVRDLPQVDCLPDNILLRIRIFMPGNRRVNINFEHDTRNIK